MNTSERSKLNLIYKWEQFLSVLMSLISDRTNNDNDLQEVLLWIYIAIVRQMFSNAAFIWRPRRHVAFVQKKLSKIQ